MAARRLGRGHPGRGVLDDRASGRVGAESGGHTAACLYSVIATCARHGLDPWRYLSDALSRLGELREPLRRATQAKDTAALDALLEPLLPDVWKTTHPDAIVPDVHNLGRPHRHRR